MNNQYENLLQGPRWDDQHRRQHRTFTYNRDGQGAHCCLFGHPCIGATTHLRRQAA